MFIFTALYTRLYNDDGRMKIDVTLEDNTVWLSQQQMAELFQTSRTNVVEHIKNIYNEGELDENSTCRNFRQVRMEGNREVTRNIPYYNLDMIISLEGYLRAMRIMYITNRNPIFLSQIFIDIFNIM
ncbi:MAG: virulence RhuM family protein [Clostridia bacterium]|nr:virulence RhuM family protein [Clostridia bacterium]